MASDDGVSLKEVTNDAVPAFADPLLVDDAAELLPTLFF
jgi:hypothetical protein